MECARHSHSSEAGGGCGGGVRSPPQPQELQHLEDERMKSDSARLTRLKHSLNAGVSRVTAPPLT